MAEIREKARWVDDIYRIQKTDAILGGEDGVINIQPTQIVQRTAFLKQSAEAEHTEGGRHQVTNDMVADDDSWRNNRGDKSGITRDEPGHTGKTLCNFIAWDENRRGGKSLPFSSLLDGVRVWPESLFRLSTHHGSGSVGGVLPHLGKPTVGPLAVVFFHR